MPWASLFKPTFEALLMYQAHRICKSEFVDVRGLQYHVRVWEPQAQSLPLVSFFLLHGWMDVSASFQFLVDRLPANWRLIAPDWRGYGLTQRPEADCYWFADYLADLDALLDHYAPEGQCNLIGHSMGGNVCALYSGIRPARVGRLINLDGIGLSPTDADEAPARYEQWLDQIKAGTSIRPFETNSAVVERLMKNNPRLRFEFAQFLAQHWASAQADGKFRILGDPAHKIVNPVLYRVDEINACWRRIKAPSLWVFAEHNPRRKLTVESAEYQRRLQYIDRLKAITLAGAGHMMHHDQPEALARVIIDFAGV